MSADADDLQQRPARCLTCWSWHTPADQVYTEIKRRAKDALLMLIEKEREGEQVITWMLHHGSHAQVPAIISTVRRCADQR